MDSFKENIDAWVKEINSKVDNIPSIEALVQENYDNVEHNYELITDLRKEVDELKKQLGSLIKGMLFANRRVTNV